ncbi:glutamine--tRNA ligase/YqeY domain fusion protein [Nannocystis sp. SCPEA4]|uniref:glutamine--tRNA ligase/YqeY domain fusion protein n=1 Tax=Nannocystis sp. SCPEA4 TaxID=2996787 RepID=UPI00226E91FB|nr:glutamine--tRNA ligase/YqeY domain fusion protein [Nannocystis sp. SCPEA4]MCY1055330.1 glutamine--tRNA ligase/YqeY domain fusion protein [Nannocystis sp. SCPEA4]
MSTEIKPPADEGPSNFIRERIQQDVAQGRRDGRVFTRFPPEPNGYLHIGHAKSICLNFGMAAEFGGRCHLRFDDTNPVTEDVEFVEAIQEDIRWLGFDWGDHKYFASDYFQKLYDYAEVLIRAGKAFVDSLTPEEIKAYRGNFYKKGTASPYRERSVEENLDLFRRMRAGEFEEGEHVLRAKIDVEHGNINMRDPPIYRIKKAHHHRTGDAWCVYPMYDYAHCISDALERITHSLCTLEFEDHRPLYDWILAQLDVPGDPEQIEFAKLNLSYTVIGKRKLKQLVEQGLVSGWDDPRMPTLAGMRRRGYTPEAIRALCERVGVSKRNGMVDVSLLEHAVREHLNATSPRVMGVLQPLKLTLTNWPAGQVEWLDAPYFADDPTRGTRPVPIGRELLIEREDFKEQAVKGWFRLSPGAEVRLRHVGIVRCDEVVKDEAGEVIELRCSLDTASRPGQPGAGRKVKGTIHWVSAAHALQVEARLYDRLFNVEEPNEAPEGKTFLDNLNPNSLTVVADARVEPSLAGAPTGTRVQFERLAYFCVDRDSTEDRLVVNRTIGMRDSWAKLEAKGG